MDISFGILNKSYSFDDSDKFEMEQLDNGDWKITVDGEVVHEGEFAPFQLTVED